MYFCPVVIHPRERMQLICTHSWSTSSKIEKYKLSQGSLFIRICSWDKELATGDWMWSNRKTRPSLENVKPQGIFLNWLITADHTSYPYVLPSPNPHTSEKRPSKKEQDAHWVSLMSHPCAVLLSLHGPSGCEASSLPGAVDVESGRITERNWKAECLFLEESDKLNANHSM